MFVNIFPKFTLFSPKNRMSTDIAPLGPSFFRVFLVFGFRTIPSQKFHKKIKSIYFETPRSKNDPTKTAQFYNVTLVWIFSVFAPPPSCAKDGNLLKPLYTPMIKIPFRNIKVSIFSSLTPHRIRPQGPITRSPT